MKDNEDKLPFVNEPEDEMGLGFIQASQLFEAFIEEKKDQRKALSPKLAAIFFPEIMVLRSYEGKVCGCCTLTPLGKKYHGAFIVINQDFIRLN
ncbi:hypothetical protein BFP97_06290 [Roseivirga sp. 4D4]|uniref:hypothetical protein n=1 Tax=Roseivirga sp. 4D4 TaxID=1889784 RepID=UPI000852B4AF|nr:hypothetical protein [Roseivirga sp. 4D4]OEK01140.1 hypothetical protein BFP97_06290 [Roseivirga sp. 4D4]